MMKFLTTMIAPYTLKTVKWMCCSLSESNGTPSSLRVVVVLGSFALIFAFIVVWIITCIHLGNIADIPAGTTAGFSAMLSILLASKVFQKGKEDGSDKS